MKILIVHIFCFLLLTVNAQPQNKSKEECFNSCYDLAVVKQRSNIDSAIIYADSCLLLAKKIESNYYLGKALQLKGRERFLMHEMDSAIIFGNQSIELLKQYPDSLDYFMAQYNQGNLYLFQDDHIQALVQFKKATKVIEDNFEMYMNIDKDRVNLNRAYCYSSIGIVYQKLSANQKAIDNMHKSINISHRVDSWESNVLRSVILGNLGQIYYHMGNYKKAESYAIAGMEQKKMLGQEGAIGYNFQVLAMSAYGRGKYKLSLKYLEQSDKKFELGQNRTERVRNNFWRAKCFMARGELKRSLDLLLSIEPDVLDQFSSGERIDFYEVLADNYQQTGDLKKANDYLRVTLSHRKRVDEKNSREIVDQFLSFFEEEEVHLNDRIQNLKNKQDREKLEIEIQAERDKKIWIYTLFIVSIVGLLLIILIISNAYRKNRKTTKELSESIDEKKVLFKEVHHRVKNNFQIISSLLNLQHGIEEDERGRKVLTDAQSRIQSMSLVHELLYRKSEVKRIDFKEYVNELVSSIIRSYKGEKEEIAYVIECGNESFDLEVAIPLGLILNEVVTNSVKYAFEDSTSGEIHVKLVKKEAAHYTLTIRDNGVGIPEQYISGKKETLGIELINILSSQLEGSVTIKVENGTTVVLDFKV
ncbi:MAG: histidine kinase dimerization/phosphoacceptor domain -containing protein [Crocinitomicaceae bacterium]